MLIAVLKPRPKFIANALSRLIKSDFHKKLCFSFQLLPQQFIISILK